jgi:hypothetical protein
MYCIFIYGKYVSKEVSNMGLTWKDLITTILAAGVFGIYYAMGKGIDLPVISGYRSAILVLGILGIAMCALSGGGGTAGGFNPFIAIISALGFAAFLLIIYGLITGAKIAFVLLSFTILAMWALATFRHAIAA